MPGKQPRVLCPVCQEAIPPDETECENCGAFVIDEAVVRLSRALGLDREKALKLFEAGFRHPTQLRDKDPNRILEKGENGLLFICTNCGGFVASGDSTCPRCAAEFETEAEETAPEADILDIVLCPVCGADNEPTLAECEICGEPLRASTVPAEPIAARTVSPAHLPTVSTASPQPRAASTAQEIQRALQKVDDFLEEPERPEAEPPPGPTFAWPAPRPAAPVVPSPPPEPAVAKPAPAEVPSKAPTVAEPKRPRPLPTPRVSPPSPMPVPAKPRALRSTPPPAVREMPAELQTVVKRRAARRPIPAGAAPSEVAAHIPRKRVREVSRGPSGLSPEMSGGFVLASAAGLLLAGALAQGIVSAGIATFLLALAAFGASVVMRGDRDRPSLLDVALLGGGALLGLGVPILGRGAAASPAAFALVLGSAVPLAWATRRLLGGPHRVLLAVASALPLIGQGFAAAADPAYTMTGLWAAGVLATMPWPAALTAIEILRRKSTTVLRRQLVRAERGLERKDYERSLVEYDRAIASARKDVPGADMPWYGKGATLILLGRYEEALRAIDTALDINPRNEIAWVNKGNVLTKLGRLVDALRCFNAAIKVNPSYEVAWNNKGNALARLGKYPEALRCYERALELDAGYRGAWVNMGYVLTKLGRFDEAASCADRALELDARHVEPA